MYTQLHTHHMHCILFNGSIMQKDSQCVASSFWFIRNLCLCYYRNLRNAEMIIRSSNQLKQFIYDVAIVCFDSLMFGLAFLLINKWTFEYELIITETRFNWNIGKHLRVSEGRSYPKYKMILEFLLPKLKITLHLSNLSLNMSSK